jgi:hypothetical protein
VRCLQWTEVSETEVDIGANPSAEEAEEGVDSSARKVVDIVNAFRLMVRLCCLLPPLDTYSHRWDPVVIIMPTCSTHGTWEAVIINVITIVIVNIIIVFSHTPSSDWKHVIITTIIISSLLLMTSVPPYS